MGGGEGREFVGGRLCRALGDVGRTLAFIPMKWELCKVLSRGGQWLDSGAHWRPLAAAGGTDHHG